MSIVIDTPYRSTRGRKPSRPAFCYDFHNDDAGGTAVVDRFGNARDLTLQGTLGASWTASRGFWRPNGTDQRALMSAGAGEDYAAQTVMADALLTPGNALFLAWRIRWATAKLVSTESVLYLGRNHATSACLELGHVSGGSIRIASRGFGASATSTAAIGSASAFVADVPQAVGVYMAATATGVEFSCFLNGVPIGALTAHEWTANSGAVPTAATFAMPDGLTIGAQKAGSNPASPTFSTRLGSGTTAKSDLSNLLGINLGAASLATATDLALELHQFPRAIGEILASL